MAASSPSFSDLIRNAGLRVTKSRIALLELMHTIHEPLALDDIDFDANRDVGDRATVFRNLHTFTESGIVTLLRGAGRRDLYEFSHGKAHAHITCTECGKTECVDASLPLPKSRARPQGWSEVEVAVNYFGRCNDCTK